VLPLRVWVLVMALATSDAAHRCVWVVALWSVLRGVGLAHGVTITPVLLLFRELNTVTVYDKAAIEVNQEGDAGRNNEGNTALIENRRTLIKEVLLRLAGSRGIWECGTLELVQAVTAFVDECGTEVVLEESDGEDDSEGEADDELDPEEEREGPDEATISNDRTDVAEETDESKDSPDGTSNDETSLKTTLDNEPKSRTLDDDPPEEARSTS